MAYRKCSQEPHRSEATPRQRRIGASARLPKEVEAAEMPAGNEVEAAFPLGGNRRSRRGVDKGTAKKPALPWHTTIARRNHFGAKRPRRLLPPGRRPKNPPDRGCRGFRQGDRKKAGAKASAFLWSQQGMILRLPDYESKRLFQIIINRVQ